MALCELQVQVHDFDCMACVRSKQTHYQKDFGGREFQSADMIPLNSTPDQQVEQTQHTL